MKNNIKVGDIFTIDAERFVCAIYRDCTQSKEYTCLAAGLEAEQLGFEPEETDVAFLDDAGDRVLTTCTHITKVGVNE